MEEFQPDKVFFILSTAFKHNGFDLTSYRR